MQSQENELVVLKKCAALEEAQQKAGAEVANTGAFSFPVVLFRQGTRTHVTGALPMNWVRQRLETRSAKPRGSLKDTQSAWNRPEMADHARAIAVYLKENHKNNYILPPLTLNVQHKVNLYTLDTQSEFRPGYLVIPASAMLAITDGQHRKSGIAIAFDEMNEEDAARFAGDSVAVMITCETDINQIHQDFADCSKTKALPPSLLAVYDRRNPANRLVGGLEEKCELFRGRIDSTSKTLSKKSTLLFLANQLRQFLKEILTGSYATKDSDFERVALELLSTEEQYEEKLNKYTAYVDRLTKVIPVWGEIAKLPPGTTYASQIPIKRAEGWICLTATGLNIIGRLGHMVFSSSKLEKDWEKYADRLGQIEWRRSAEIWQGNIVQNNRILTQTGPLKAAFQKICETIGLGNEIQQKVPEEVAAK